MRDLRGSVRGRAGISPGGGIPHASARRTPRILKFPSVDRESAMLCTHGIVVKRVHGDCVCSSSGVDSKLKRICHEL